MRLQCPSFTPGGVPEWPKGTGCKPVGSAYGGSNPPAPTKGEELRREASLKPLRGLSLRRFESFASTAGEAVILQPHPAALWAGYTQGRP